MGDDHFEPRQFAGVTVSSTFTDLEEHRTALIKAIKSHGLTDVAMENDSARLIDVIDSSLQMVRYGSAYIGIISMKYGQVPVSPTKNPNNLSITELEFNEALRLDRPILLFIMGEGHLVLPKNVERDPTKIVKLDAFRERAKKMKDDPGVHRVYSTFNSVEDFKVKIGPSIAELRIYLVASAKPLNNTVPPLRTGVLLDPIPNPPHLYAQPAYIGSHRFVGREAQLEALNDWARPADTYTLLLFESIGGNGKSMLTWEWTRHHASAVRKDWEGIFWYSFYERGAVMADFCRHALAYMTCRPLEDFKKKKTLELKDLLIHHLNNRPWLFILDGLERVLVAYHRIDAAEIADEELNTPMDKIINRDPCSCINDEDDDLLRSLAAASPSKLLISSRLVPRVLLNAANQPIPGVQRILLTGLRPGDAEKLFRSCEVKGSSEAMQDFLLTSCDCHPLTIGVLAGLVNNYLPDKGNFDAWIIDADGGGQLDISSLDLVQKRNHIFETSLGALSEKSLELLSILALMSESVDYSTLAAFNPHMPPEPEKVIEPEKPKFLSLYQKISNKEKAERRIMYEADLEHWKVYQQAMQARRLSFEYLTASKELMKTARDLEVRGLLQYDHNNRRFDLHPVVRGVAVNRLQYDKKEQYGQRVVDHFSSQAHNPYEQAETLDDLRSGINIVRTLLKMDHYEDAYNILSGDLCNALFFNLEAFKEVSTLVRPFFPNGWSRLPTKLKRFDGCILASYVTITLDELGESKEALIPHGIIILDAVDNGNLNMLSARLINVAKNLYVQNNLAAVNRVLNLSLTLTTVDNNEQSLFISRSYMFSHLSRIGQWTKAEAMWSKLNAMGRNWPRSQYRPGEAEYLYALFQFRKEDLQEEQLVLAERLASEGKSRYVIRNLHWLRGMWLIEQGQWHTAINSLNEGVRMARIIGQVDSEAETWFALVKFYLGKLSDPLGELERLSQFRVPTHRPLAELWRGIGNHNQAKKHALEAYKWAWASGEPYVHLYELKKITALLNNLGVEVPKLHLYNPSIDENFSWEGKVETFIEKLKYRKQKKNQ